jgi:hypothetical protein
MNRVSGDIDQRDALTALRVDAAASDRRRVGGRGKIQTGLSDALMRTAIAPKFS